MVGRHLEKKRSKKLSPPTLRFPGPNERNQGKQAHPVIKYLVPHGSQCVMSRLIHTVLGSSSLIAHVLHSPNPSMNPAPGPPASSGPYTYSSSTHRFHTSGKGAVFQHACYRCQHACYTPNMHVRIFPTWRFEKIPCQHGAPFPDAYRAYASFIDIYGAWFGLGSGFGIGFTLTLLLAHALLLLATFSHSSSHTLVPPFATHSAHWDRLLVHWGAAACTLGTRCVAA